MLQSHLFTKVGTSFPKDEESANAKYLIRGGFIRKLSAGVNAYLPLGLRVIEKINRIVREEMHAIGAEELLFPALVAREYWEKSGRWGMKVGYEFKSPSGEDVALGWTHEEVAASIATQFISSYKDLPKAVYQIQTKFRDEPRAKGGLLRGREFLMKDLYSFHATKADLDQYYQTVIDAYAKILKRLTLKTRVTEAAGGAFTKEYTHEFQVLHPAGEDTVLFCSECDFSQNRDIAKVGAGDACPHCSAAVQESHGIEVANVFKLGTRYSDAFGLTFDDEAGKKQSVVMGSYGIGPSRLLGTLVEVYHDEAGILWPESVAPFAVHLVSLAGENAAVAARAKDLYTKLSSRGIEALYDDRDLSAGRKLADADFIGIPVRAIVSEKTGEKVEVKRRDEKEAILITPEELMKIAIGK